MGLNLEKNLGKNLEKIFNKYDKCAYQSHSNPRREYVRVQELAKSSKEFYKRERIEREKQTKQAIERTSTRRPSITIERSLSARTVASLCS